MEISESKPQNNYESVGGWLLLLCISLTIISPIRVIYQSSINFMIISSFLNDFDPEVKTIVFLEIFVGIAITIYSIITGVFLWQIKANAVKFAKTFFVVFLAYVILAAIVSYIYTPESIDYIKNTIGNLLYFSIWYTYLVKSKRVKLTYKF